MAINNSNLPTVQTFKVEQFPGAPEYFSQFLTSLNLFVTPVSQILNGGVSYQNLTVPQLYTKTITAPASGNVTFSFTNPLRIQPSAVLIGNVYVQNQPTNHPTSPVSVFWHTSQNMIYIDQITNLTAATTYAVTLVVL